LEIRDGWLLVQTRLSLPALSPDTVRGGQTRIRLEGDWGSDFGWRGAPSSGQDLRFMFDGEHRSAALTVSHGLGRSRVTRCGFRGCRRRGFYIHGKGLLRGLDSMAGP